MADNNSSLAGLQGYAAQVQAANMQMAFNASESRKSRDFAVEMYDRQRSDALADITDARNYYQRMLADERAYNSSASQVARLKAAGLNPALAYGGQVTTAAPSGGFSSSTPQPAHAVSTPIAQVGSFDLAGGFQSIFSAMTNKRVADSNIRNQDLMTKADVILKAAQSRLLDSENAGTMLENLFMESTLDERVELVNLQIESSLSSISNLNLQNQSLQNEINSFTLRMEKLKSEIASINADTSLTEDKRSELISIKVKNYADAEYTSLNSLKNRVEKEIASQHLSQEQFKTETQQLTYVLDAVSQGIDSVTSIIDSVTGGVGKFFSGIFNKKRASTVQYDSQSRRMDAESRRMDSESRRMDSESRRMDAVTRRNNSLKPSDSSSYRAALRRRRSNQF